LLEGASGCVVVQSAASRRLLVLLGTTDLVLVDAGDVVLACPRNRPRDVRALMERLAREHPELL